MISILLLLVSCGMYAIDDTSDRSNLCVYVQKLSGGVYDDVDAIYDNGNKELMVHDIKTLSRIRQFIDTVREVEWGVHKQQIPTIITYIDSNHEKCPMHWGLLRSHLVTLQHIDAVSVRVSHASEWSELSSAAKKCEDDLSRLVRECIRAEVMEDQVESPGAEADGELLESLQQMLCAMEEIAQICESA